MVGVGGVYMYITSHTIYISDFLKMMLSEAFWYGTILNFFLSFSNLSVSLYTLSPAEGHHLRLCFCEFD